MVKLRNYFSAFTKDKKNIKIGFSLRKNQGFRKNEHQISCIQMKLRHLTLQEIIQKYYGYPC